MKTQVFITPWRNLTNDEILSCIKAGADSARIHTGKLDSNRIKELIEFYNSHNFKLYLDLRGNKPQTESKCIVGIDDVVIFYLKGQKPDAKGKFIEVNYIPQIISKYPNGDLTIDDGKLIFEFEEFYKNLKNEIVAIKTKVTKASISEIFYGDGISSISIPIHSYADDPFTEFDINILKNIPLNIRDTLKYIVVSFAESKNQLILAKELIRSLGFINAQIVPKVETVQGMENINEILKWLVDEYKEKAEFQIGRGDLTLDSNRYNPKRDMDELIDSAIEKSKLFNVKVSVLALIMQSLRYRLKKNPKTMDLSLEDEEYKYINKLCELGVYQIGLTNDMYVDKPEIIVRTLKNLLF
jgi:pyruvate kinase